MLRSLPMISLMFEEARELFQIVIHVKTHLITGMLFSNKSLKKGAWCPKLPNQLD